MRDQIRQVVTDLEDVLGGLKQVHVEMKEVGGSIIIDVYSLHQVSTDEGLRQMHKSQPFIDAPLDIVTFKMIKGRHYRQKHTFLIMRFWAILLP